jgi:hypothetical protein
MLITLNRYADQHEIWYVALEPTAQQKALFSKNGNSENKMAAWRRRHLGLLCKVE